MSLLEYYKKYLSEDVVKVEPLYFDMNLTNDTSGIEFWDKVTYSNDVQEYYPSISEYDHNLSKPFDMPKKWLDVSVESDFNPNITEEDAENLSVGKGW